MKTAAGSWTVRRFWWEGAYNRGGEGSKSVQISEFAPYRLTTAAEKCIINKLWKYWTRKPMLV